MLSPMTHVTVTRRSIVTVAIVLLLVAVVAIRDCRGTKVKLLCGLLMIVLVESV